MRLAALPLLLLVVPIARADEIDDLVRAEMVKSKAPGVVIAVVKDGKLVRSQAYGLANVEHNVPATTDTVFRVASMSKQFCAAATMLLVQDGKASVKDSIRKWLPDAPESWQGITLHHLLTHTSGMPDLGHADGFWFETRMTSDEFLQALYKKPLKRAPGSSFEYSNPGYSLLGILVGKISGKSLEEVVTERILKPTGMDRTRYYTPYDVVPNRASGYEKKADGVQNALFLRPSMMQGSGGLMSTVLDFVKWDAALTTENPLSKTVRDTVWAPQVKTEDEDRYGYGWFLQTVDGKRIVRHSGGTLGFTSNFLRHLDDRLTVVVLENVAGGGAVKLSEAIAAHYLKSKSSAAP
jgi:CubicO group peptidase (beta-lactamase class C family)